MSEIFLIKFVNLFIDDIRVHQRIVFIRNSINNLAILSPKRLNVKFMRRLSRDHLTMIGEEILHFLPFFLIKEVPVSPPWGYFFLVKKAQKKITPGESIKTLTMPQEKASERPSTNRTSSRTVVVVAQWLFLLGSWQYSQFSIKYDIFMKCQSPEDNGCKIPEKKPGKGGKKVHWEMGFFLGFLLLLSAAPCPGPRLRPMAGHKTKYYWNRICV